MKTKAHCRFPAGKVRQFIFKRKAESDIYRSETDSRFSGRLFQVAAQKDV